MTTTPVIEDQVESPEPGRRVPGWISAIAKFLGVVAFVALIAVAGYHGALRLAEAVSPDPVAAIAPGVEVTVVVPAGSSARAISNQLEDQAVIADGNAFLAEVERRGATDQLRAGTYVLVSGCLLYTSDAADDRPRV